MAVIEALADGHSSVALLVEDLGVQKEAPPKSIQRKKTAAFLGALVILGVQPEASLNFCADNI